ncbi:dienelactone hydrolase [Geopyxis carbonaria]|nr:dienelactone hydrolase [Geopyxis carbonaria]
MASKACCTIPPVVSDTDAYKLQGSHDKISDLKTYVTGSTDSKTGVLVIYDIFGLDFAQTLQGADIIASSTSSLVVIPDFFKGEPMAISGFPPDTPEKQKALGEFFAGPAAPPKTVAKVGELVPLLKEKYPSVERWALMGYCWGGKVTALLSGAGCPFVGSAQIHPAMMDAEDAAKLTVPHFVLATKDEDAETTEKVRGIIENHQDEAVRTKSQVMRWEGTFHGFMAARVDLKDAESKAYYEKGYKKLVHWLKEVL